MPRLYRSSDYEDHDEFYYRAIYGDGSVDEDYDDVFCNENDGIAGHPGDYLTVDEYGNVVTHYVIPQQEVVEEEEEEVVVVDIFGDDFENVPVQIAQKDGYTLAFYTFLCNNNVPNAWYLFKCTWFTQSFELACFLSSVVRAGHASRINVYAENFRQHLEELML
jgi:hypothetical protein